MSHIQLQRLQEDSQELGLYVTKLEQTGKQDLAIKIKQKQRYLDSKISEARELMAS